MLSSILKMIKDFVIVPAGTTSLIILIIGFIIFLVFKYSFKSSLIKSILASFLTFSTFTIFMVLAIKLNNPKFNYLIYPIVLNIWLLSFQKIKYRLILANILTLIAFFSEFYIVEKIFFE